jgi:hypothetical protein
MYMPSKVHLGINADMRECHHIGTGLSVTIFLPPFFVYYSDGSSWIDAPDFYESSFWKESDPESGLGGWGDPNADFAVPDGGFHTLRLSYPSPHTVRRNFSLLSFNFPFPAPIVTDPLKMGNTSFTASVIEAILKTSAGNYKEFQTALEAPEVRKMDISNMGRGFSS